MAVFRFFRSVIPQLPEIKITMVTWILYNQDGGILILQVSYPTAS
jgi:hypothetical protein